MPAMDLTLEELLDVQRMRSARTKALEEVRARIMSLPLEVEHIARQNRIGYRAGAATVRYAARDLVTEMIDGKPFSPDLSDIGPYALPEDSEIASEAGQTIEELRQSRVEEERKGITRYPAGPERQAVDLLCRAIDMCARLLPGAAEDGPHAADFLDEVESFLGDIYMRR